MMYLVYPTEAAAQAAQSAIFQAGAAMEVAAGATFDGAVLTTPSGGQTVRWDTPRQTADGWVIEWPADHPAMTPALLSQLVALLAANGLAATPRTVGAGWFSEHSNV